MHLLKGVMCHVAIAQRMCFALRRFSSRRKLTDANRPNLYACEVAARLFYHQVTPIFTTATSLALDAHLPRRVQYCPCKQMCNSIVPHKPTYYNSDGLEILFTTTSDCLLNLLTLCTTTHCGITSQLAWNLHTHSHICFHWARPSQKRLIYT